LCTVSKGKEEDFDSGDDNIKSVILEYSGNNSLFMEKMVPSLKQMNLKIWKEMLGQIIMLWSDSDFREERSCT
jgi:hypothetical protein